MRKLILALLVSGLAMSIGASGVFAGGASDTSGDGFHCYLFFELPDERFAQFMVNDSDAEVVFEKVAESFAKYAGVGGEGGTLTVAAGDAGNCSCNLAPIEFPPICVDLQGQVE